MSKFTNAAAAAALVALSSPVLAGNSVGACSVTDLTANATACMGYVAGNDDSTQLLSLVGATWLGVDVASLIQNKDDNVGVGSTVALFDGVKGTPADTGTLTFAQAISGPFIVTLKGGNEFAAYLYTGGVAAGTVLSFDIPNNKGNGYSHGSVYAAAPVPEPETYAMMLAGLAAMGFMARRRRAA